MLLLIDTTQQEKIILQLFDERGSSIARQEKRVFQISENLLPELERFIKKQKLKLRKLTKILVDPGPGGFSSTRTGVATANALAYALGIPVAEFPSGKIKEIVLPKYDKKPNITRPKALSDKL